ncbi:Uncharacterized protein Tcan_11659 [Toxocara canis]|uniref:Bestrophin homolog n=1 Tax=Toxocara canis TaxID=6265 RepID=A0A0B2VP89_TOXCA|nr:Uncharacterized protein Tcan_11659 [Toxocara canis]
MTVKYNLDVSTSRPWTLFKLLVRWRGSIWKSVLLELAVWLILFLIITIVYRVALTPEQVRSFEQFVHYCDDKLDYIPLNFMLGFFVTSVLNRWINFFSNIGYIDNNIVNSKATSTLYVRAYVRGTDEKTRMQRRNIVRYCVLSQALIFRDISMRVRKRFPSIETLVAAGFMMEHEKEKYDEIQYRYAKYWMPFQWALALCQEARNQQKIASDILLQKVGEEIKVFRTNLAILCNFDWVPLPIMYPQLIALAVHTYFLICVLSRQFIISEGAANKSRMDLFFPVMTVLQFVFYMGWLKVAEAMLNPFGEDDDDFECNFLLDKNLTIGLTVVDEGYGKTPSLKKDIFWDEKIEPLYTLESVSEEQPMCGITGSTANVKITEREHEIKMLPLPHDTEGNHHAHSFGLLRRSVQKRFGSRADCHLESSALKGFHHHFVRSMSHNHVHFPTSLSTDRSGKQRKPQSELNLSSLEQGHNRNDDRRGSLSGALEAIVNESGAYSNLGVIIGDESPAPTKEATFAFPSHREFHGHYGSETVSPNVTSHRLEDLAEECEENSSKTNTIVKVEDEVRPSIITIASSMNLKQNRSVEDDNDAKIDNELQEAKEDERDSKELLQNDNDNLKKCTLS